MFKNADKFWEYLKSGKPYIIAEAGVNHLGSMKLGEDLIAAAAQSGATAIKFQSYKAKNLCTKHAERFWDWEGEEKQDGTQIDSYSILDSFEEEEHKQLKDICDKYEIEFMSTPFDNHAVDYLDRIGVNAYKVASCDITNFPLLEHMAKKEKIIMLSTGASDLHEIEAAVDLISKYTEKIVIMHCNLKYPTDIHEANLSMITSLREKFGDKYVYGLSDHTMDLLTPALSYVLGGTVIERHFTVDKSLDKSADHWLSADPTDLRAIAYNVSVAAAMMGEKDKKCTDSEYRARKYARRSVVSTKNIAVGEAFTEKNIACKRPGTGLSPTLFGEILGKKAKKDIKEDDLLTNEDIGWNK